MLQTEAGYIDARPQTCSPIETSCDARPDHISGRNATTALLGTLIARDVDSMAKRHLERMRAICLALPEAVERETWDQVTFRVREKIFAMHIDDDGDGRPALWCKAATGNQTHLIEADPERFFVPPYVGHKGCVGMWLDRRVDWHDVSVVVKRSYRLTAPKRVAALVE
jgi:hypothetical protein